MQRSSDNTNMRRYVALQDFTNSTEVFSFNEDLIQQKILPNL